MLINSTYSFYDARNVLVERLTPYNIRSNITELEKYIYDVLRYHSKNKGHLSGERHLYNSNELEYLYHTILVEYYRNLI